MGHFLAVRTRTGDQIHLSYVPEGREHPYNKTNCGCRVTHVLKFQFSKRRPGLLCERCFHPTLPMENVKNLTLGMEHAYPVDTHTNKC